MATKSYWYDGMMDADDLSAIESLLKNSKGELAGISESFQAQESDNGIRSKIEKAASLKVHRGAQRPIIRHTHHGKIDPFSIEKQKPEDGFAWDAMYAAAKEIGNLTLLCAGSLTNIALAILRYHDFVDFLERIIFIAGTIGVGERLPMSENKAILDPYAMKTVLTSGANLLYVGNGSWTSDRVAPIDLVSSAINIDELRTRKANMDIETVGGCEFARTVIDTRANSQAKQNIEFVYIDHFY